jgi:hypothetical protein
VGRVPPRLLSVGRLLARYTLPEDGTQYTGFLRDVFPYLEVCAVQLGEGGGHQLCHQV